MSRIPNTKSNTPPKLLGPHKRSRFVELARISPALFELQGCHLAPILDDFGSFWAFVEEIAPEALVTSQLIWRSLRASLAPLPVS